MEINSLGDEEVMEIETSWELKGKQEGKQEEALALIMRLLPRRIGTISPQLQERITELSLTQLEDLAEALLDFSNAEDLVHWLGR